jgi:hypothetical protein
MPFNNVERARVTTSEDVRKRKERRKVRDGERERKREREREREYAAYSRGHVVRCEDTQCLQYSLAENVFQTISRVHKTSATHSQ